MGLRIRDCLFARHSSAGWNPVLSWFLMFRARASTRPSAERVTFLCLCGLCKEKSPKETHPGAVLSGHPATAPALLYLRHPCRRLPSEFAIALRGSLTIRPRTDSELARIVRASLLPFLRALAAAQGPGYRVSCAQKPEQAMRYLAVIFSRN
jgi:hypothetical protein